jgi:hypothetical protein
VSAATRLACCFLLPMLLVACASQDEKPANAEGTSIPPIWDVSFVGTGNEDLGSLRIALTSEPIDEDYCGASYLRKAIVLEDHLDVDLGMDKQPAYSISMFWLWLDLTASSCNTNFLLLGNIDPDESVGFFNYAHPLGGESIGRFEAVPVE